MAHQLRRRADVFGNLAHFPSGFLNDQGSLFGHFLGFCRDMVSTRRTMRIGFLLFDTLGNVTGKLDDLVELAVDIKNRVIRCFQPDNPAMFAEAFELIANELALIQLAPEFGIFRAVGQCRFAERSVVFTFDLVQCVTHDVQEVTVGGYHIAIGLEFANSHGPVYCCQLAVGLVFEHYAFSDVQSIFDHLEDFALRIGHRVVACLQPDATAILVDALEGAGDELASLQRRPQVRVFTAAEHLRLAKVAVRLAGQLIGPVAHRCNEVIVGTKDLAVETQLDHRH
ncbi:hypothetical protein ALO49_200323 [Pseudomonas savastanoi pv. retacarpa]|nr:hypothetical protein ALO49_200323 [Pseudomonas savastanoi pv. retacarpa]